MARINEDNYNYRITFSRETDTPLWKPVSHLQASLHWSNRSFYTVKQTEKNELTLYGDWDNQEIDMVNFSTYYPGILFLVERWKTETPGNITSFSYKDGKVISDNKS